MPSTSAECWDAGAREFAASAPATLADAAPAGPAELAARPVRFDKGSALARGVLRLFGWRVVADGLPARQGVVVVYPHTSNWDFVWAMLAKWALGVEITFWGKATLFRIPLMGRWLRWLGGIPVVRDAPNGVVGQMAQRLPPGGAAGRGAGGAGLPRLSAARGRPRLGLAPERRRAGGPGMLRQTPAGPHRQARRARRARAAALTLSTTP